MNRLIAECWRHSFTKFLISRRIRSSSSNNSTFISTWFFLHVVSWTFSISPALSITYNMSLSIHQRTEFYILLPVYPIFLRIKSIKYYWPKNHFFNYFLFFIFFLVCRQYRILSIRTLIHIVINRYAKCLPYNCQPSTSSGRLTIC